MSRLKPSGSDISEWHPGKPKLTKGDLYAGNVKYIIYPVEVADIILSRFVGGTGKDTSFNSAGGVS